MADYAVVGANIDTWILNVKGDLPEGLAEALDQLKEASQEADEDVSTSWCFAGDCAVVREPASLGEI